jgi:hypothetical protein
LNRKIAVMAIIVAFVGGMFFAGTPVEAKKGGGGDVIDQVWAAIAGLDTRVSELEADPHMVKTVKFNRLDGSGALEGQTPTYLDYSTTANVTSDGNLTFQFVGMDVICSDIRVHYSVDGVPKGTTDWLGYVDRIPNLPLSTDIISIDSLASGEHTLTLRPEGRVSGCNTAGIAAWGGTIQLYQ